MGLVLEADKSKKEMRIRKKYQKDDPTIGSGSGLR